MSIALVFATVAGALAFALWIAAELFSPSARWWIPCAALVALAGGVSGSFIARAETPFGAGNGVVPDLVGEDWCSAEERLDKRELRWRHDGQREIHRGRCPEDIGGTSFDVQRQSPPAGTELGPGGVVTLDSGCGRSRDRGCG